MEYEEAVKLWASRKYDIALSDITSVTLDFEQEEGICCGNNTCYFEGEKYITIDISAKIPEYHTISGYNFGQLVQEIVGTANGL